MICQGLKLLAGPGCPHIWSILEWVHSKQCRQQLLYLVLQPWTAGQWSTGDFGEAELKEAA